jgi:hypothetical protein
MGIMDMFSGILSSANPPAPAAQPTGQGQNTGAPTPGNLPANAPTTGATAAGTAANGALPTAGVGDTTPAPFDTFKDLWQTVPVDPAAPANKGVFGDLDPKRFMEAAGKIDFSKAVTADQLTAISAGGDAAMQAFAAAMNNVAQGVYAQSAFATTKIVEQALSRSKESFMAELPGHIKKQTVTDSLRQENPVFSNPAVQPIIAALESQLTLKHPNATAPEITALAKQYVEAFGTAVAPKPQTPQGSTNTKNDVDWDKFMFQ